MPIYTYECKECGGSKEVIKSIKEIDDRVECERCTTTHQMKRVVSSSTFILKGDGWAVDGYDKLIGDINITRKRDGKSEVDYNDIHGTDW